jgi:signal transduction histidine kinase
LMTPLTAVLGRLDALCMDDLQLTTEERGEQAHHAMHEAQRLERLIGDLLASVRLEAGAVTLTVAPVVVRDLFEGVVSRHGDECRKRRITVDEEIAADQVMADAFRLDQALDNLFANALRHTPEGGRIAFRVRHIVDGVELTVWDSGGAIAPEHLPHIFDRFYKAASARGTASPGSGLGLSIVKAIIERHGGSISATSSPRSGTTFTMVLPHQKAVDTDVLAATV